MERSLGYSKTILRTSFIVPLATMAQVVRAPCSDTPDWTNRYGASCRRMQIDGHCAGGRFVSGHEWAAAAQFGTPGMHCCVCGKLAHQSVQTLVLQELQMLGSDDTAHAMKLRMWDTRVAIPSLDEELFDSLFTSRNVSRSSLRFADVVSAFRAPGTSSQETRMRVGRVHSTLFLVGIDSAGTAGVSLRTASLMSTRESSTAVGMAAWRRQRRLAWLLWQAVLRPSSRMPIKLPLVFLVDLDDLSDGLHRAAGQPKAPPLPTFASNGGVCAPKLAVPIPLKGFGTTDLERRLVASARNSGGAASMRPDVAWEARVSSEKALLSPHPHPHPHSHHHP